MPKAVRFLMLFGLVTAGLIATSVSRLEAHCIACVWGSSGGGCTACEAHWGDGYLTCTPSCSGYCTVSGPCAVVLDQARFSPAGQVLAYARVGDRSDEHTGVSLDVSSASTWAGVPGAAVGIPSSWEGEGISLRNCAGWIITPALTPQDEGLMRVATHRMLL